MNAKSDVLMVDDEAKKSTPRPLTRASSDSGSNRNPPINVLLVDDDPRNLDVLESILGMQDLQLVRAQSADETLLALIQQDFAAIVLDIQMPGMTGFELARIIKQRKRSQHIPIIFLTAYFQEARDMLSGYGVGAVDYLTKPVDPQILKSKVNVFVELFRTTRALAAANHALENEIAERKQAELALTQLAAIVESSSDAILSKTLDGIITSWNTGAERIFGYTAGEIVGRPISILLPADRTDELKLINENLQQGELIEPFETVRVRKDGHQVDVSLSLSPVKDATGKITGISSIMRDIGERKRLEAEILQVSEREQRRIADDLHDGLGQQLAGISCLCDALHKELTDQASPQATVAAKISKLLDAAVVQNRNLARGLHPVVTETNGLMSALEDLSGTVSDMFKVACRFECPQPVLVQGNQVATHLYRIAQEAVTNSLKHGRARRIEIGLSTAQGRITLAVNDDGVGFTKPARQHKGMGLRIMNYRASIIGGTLVIQRNDGNGTKVVCTVEEDGIQNENPE